MSMFMKEHDNTSKPDVIPGNSRERDLPSTHMAPRKETWVPNLRWQFWVFLEHTEHQEQSSDRDKALTGATGNTDIFLRWQSDLANPSLPEGSQNIAGSSWVWWHPIQTIRAAAPDTSTALGHAGSAQPKGVQPHQHKIKEN